MGERIVSRFDARSTAREVVQDVDLAGRVFIVTGGASGIGVETARALAEAAQKSCSRCATKRRVGSQPAT